MLKMIETPGRGTVKARHTYRGEDTGTSEAVEVPNTGNDILVMAQPADGGSIDIQYSISSLALIREGNGIWESWGQGDVSELTSGAVTAGITALRAVVTGDAATWEVTA